MSYVALATRGDSIAEDDQLFEGHSNADRQWVKPSAWLAPARSAKSYVFVCIALLVLGVLFLPKYPQFDLPSLRFRPTTPASASSPGALDPFKLAAIIETRNLPVLEPLIRHFIFTAPPEWPFQLWAPPDVLEHANNSGATRELIRSGKLSLRELPEDVPLTNGLELSAFLVKPWFWEQLAPAEHILFFQSDSIICSRSKSNLNDFLGLDTVPGGYDFVGAPWGWKGWPQDHEGGNGGLSIRRRSSMLDIAKRYGKRWDGLNEDQFFINHLASQGRIPDFNTTAAFAFETTQAWSADEAEDYDWTWRPFGVHVGTAGAMCTGKSRLQEPTWFAKRIMDWCPEIRMILPNECT